MPRFRRAIDERRIDLERTAEGGDGGGEVVLLEARDADVVGAVGVFAGGRSAPGSEDRRDCPQFERGFDWLELEVPKPTLEE